MIIFYSRLLSSRGDSNETEVSSSLVREIDELSIYYFGRKLRRIRIRHFGVSRVAFGRLKVLPHAALTAQGTMSQLINELALES
jgi:hypothetical protein